MCGDPAEDLGDVMGLCGGGGFIDKGKCSDWCRCGLGDTGTSPKRADFLT